MGWKRTPIVQPECLPELMGQGLQVIERINVQSGSPRLPTRWPRRGLWRNRWKQFGLEAAEGHVGRIWGKKYERLWRSATGFFDWKNSTAYFSPLILYSYPQIHYPVHVPNNRYILNDRNGGTSQCCVCLEPLLLET